MGRFHGIQACLHTIGHTTLFLALLMSNIGQRIAFKNVGYALGPYPYFVLLSISFAFVIIFAAICAFIIATTGGWLPGSNNWRTLGVFSVIGCCNALQGAGMVFANPHVAGYVQALLQQAVIPLTLALSVVLLSSWYTRQQYFGVFLIVAGIAVELVPSLGPADAGQAGSGPPVHLAWTLVFLVAQVPVSLAAIVQERAFSAQPVNVFHMMFFASAAQFLLLLALAPVDAVPMVGDSASFHDLAEKFSEAWGLVQGGSAGIALVACVGSMLASQVTQAFMVKHSSAAYTVLCMALVMPASAVAFTSPALMGSHAEHLAATTQAAVVLVFVGIVCYRYGDITEAKVAEDSATEALLPVDPLGGSWSRQISAESAAPQKDHAPVVVAAGVGMVASGYTNARKAHVGLLEECTLKETDAESGPHEETQTCFPA